MLRWIDAAILSPAVLGVSVILSSHILSKRMPSLQSYLLVGGIANLIWGLVFLKLFPLPEGISLWVLLVAIVSCLIRGTGVVFFLYTLRREEASRIVPVVFTYPVFVAIMAVPLLGETVSYVQWLAIIIVVAGAVMVSFKESPSGSTSWLGKTFLLLLGISLLYALADITSKYALAYFSPWNMLGLTSLCLAIVWLAVSMRHHVFGELNNIRQRCSTMALVTFAEMLAVIGIVLLLWAMQGAPVSLVSAIAGSRPIFVVMYTIVLSRLSPQFLIWSGGKWTWALRLVATVMIAGGISVIYLT